MLCRDFLFIKNNESDKLISTIKKICDSVGKYKHGSVIKTLSSIYIYKTLALQKERERESALHFYLFFCQSSSLVLCGRER